MIVYYPLCHGADLPLCSSCSRHADQHPAAALDPHQPFLTPATDGARCRSWLARPSLLTPKTDTGD